MNSDDEEVILETEDVIDEPEENELENEDKENQIDENENENDDDEQYIEDEDNNMDFNDCLEINDIHKLNNVATYTEPEKRTSKNKMTRYEFVRIIGERVMQLTKGAKPLIKQNKQSAEFTYKEIAIEELKTNMIPFKIRRFVKDHYEIWKVEELNKKHLEPLFY